MHEPRFDTSAEHIVSLDAKINQRIRDEMYWFAVVRQEDVNLDDGGYRTRSIIADIIGPGCGIQDVESVEEWEANKRYKILSHPRYEITDVSITADTKHHQVSISFGCTECGENESLISATRTMFHFVVTATNKIHDHLMQQISERRELDAQSEREFKDFLSAAMPLAGTGAIAWVDLPVAIQNYIFQGGDRVTFEFKEKSGELTCIIFEGKLLKDVLTYRIE